MPVHQCRQVGSFQDDDRYVVLLERLEHEGKVLVEQGVPGAGHEIDFAQAPQGVGGDGVVDSSGVDG